jgi:hypothetical protein
MSVIEIVDRFGRKRRARPGEKLADGERIFLMFTDAAPAQSGGFRRGFAFAQDMAPASNDTAHADAAKAYAERSRRLEDAWRRKDGQQQQDSAAPTSTQDARAIADAAYADKKQRLQGGWKQR